MMTPKPHAVRPTPGVLFAAALAAAIAPHALALEDAAIDAIVAHAVTTSVSSASAQTETPEPPHTDAPPSIAFTDAGYRSFEVEAAAAFTTNNRDYQLRLGFSEFLADDFEFSFGLSGWYHDQDTDNQGSAAFDLTFRYHAFGEDTPRGVSPTWTLYAEAGIGMLFSTGDVPDLGSEVNFIPRAGGGVSWKPFDDSAMRVNAGIRWHHISNASIFGSDENPDRDALMFFAGVRFPL